MPLAFRLISGVVGEIGPPSGNDSAERGRALQCNREVAVERTGENGVTKRCDFAWSRRFGDARYYVRHLGDSLAGVEEPGRVDAIPMNPGAKQVQRPQRARQSFRAGIAPQVGDLVQANVVREPHQAAGAFRICPFAAAYPKDGGSGGVGDGHPVSRVRVAGNVWQRAGQQRPQRPATVLITLPSAHMTIVSRGGKAGPI